MTDQGEAQGTHVRVGGWKQGTGEEGKPRWVQGRAATRAFTIESVLYHFAPLPLSVFGLEPPLRSRVEGHNFLALLGRWLPLIKDRERSR